MTTNANAAPQLLFYKKPMALLADKHAEAGIVSEPDYSFSKKTNSVPISHVEFAEVAKHYPIVFATNINADPIAVLGMETDKNTFVNSYGKWTKASYIPAYIQRYPFAFMSPGDNSNKLVLCFDESSKLISKKAKGNDTRFFKNGEQTDFIKQTLQKCLGYHNDLLITQKFVKLIKDAGLLIEKNITLAPLKSTEKPVSLSGFQVVDSEKLKNLDEKTLVEWHRNGLLSLIYMHMMSLSNFANLRNSK